MVDKELVPTTNDDKQGQVDYHGRAHGRRRGQGRGGAYVNPIELMVEHAYHQYPQWKKKAPLCSTH